MAVKLQQVKLLFSKYAGDFDKLTAAINLAITKFDLSTDLRLNYFLSQIAFESGYLTSLSENLNYSKPERIVAVWPSRFNVNVAKDGKLNATNFIHNPQLLANTVYANRNGNGPASSGDGYKYRGRGAIQLTFKDNYSRASQDIYGDDRLVVNPDLVSTDPEAIILTAGWFWSENGLNKLADRDQFTLVTKKINGSTSTVPQRLPVLAKVKSIFV